MTIDPPGLGSQRSATTSRSAASILRRTLRDSPPSGLMPSIFRSRRGGASGAASGVPCHGVPGILIENDVHHWGEAIGDLRTLIRYRLHGATQLISGFALRRVPRIITETEELRTMLVERRGIA